MKLIKTLLAFTSLIANPVWGKTLGLPFWEEEATKLGYVLPKPFGINVGYMNLRQGIVVDHVGGFDTVKLTPNELRDVVNDIAPGILEKPVIGGIINSAINSTGVLNYTQYLIQNMQTRPHDGKQETNVFTIRGDVWLLPFLNVYAIGGKVSGYSQTKVDYSLPTFNGKVMADKLTQHMTSWEKLLYGKIIQGLTSQLDGATASGTIEEFRLNLDGYMYGGGVVLAGGYGRFFGVLDASYTQTTFTVIDGSISAIVITPRIGYDFTDFGWPIRFWTGAMYQNVEQELSGKLADLNLPDMYVTIKKPDGSIMGKPIKIPKISNGEFNVKQHLVTEWNPILGMQYNLSQNFDMLVEAGLGDRKSIFATLNFRF